MNFVKSISRTRWVMSLENLVPFALRMGLFLIAAFTALKFDLFSLAPLWGHIALLILLAGQFIYALFAFRGQIFPSQDEILTRLDQASTLKHRPVSSLLDQPVSQNAHSLALFEAHKAQVLTKLKSLPKPKFNANLHAHDPFALRSIAAITLVLAVFLGGKSDIKSLFDFDKALPANWRADLWLTPPTYTGLPAKLIFSDKGDPNAPKITLLTSEAVKGSKISMQQEGLTRFSSTLTTDELKEDLTFTLQGLPKRDALTFKIKALDDRAPQISFIGNLKADDKGKLSLTYKIDDDFGAREANAFTSLTTELRETLSRNPRPAVEFPKIPLLLPPKGTFEAQTQHDLERHPFAGLTLNMQLEVFDDLNQKGVSDIKSVTLPRRPFNKPLALALLEQRTNLALDMNLKRQVLRGLEAMMIAPQVFTPETAIYLGLRTSYQRLNRARNKEQIISVIDYLYEIALFIEEGYGAESERRFNALREELRQAMERNAPADEIARLMQQLREALAAMMREMAQNLRNQPQQQRPPQQGQQQARDLNDILKQIEELMRQGAHDQARRMLEELQRQMAEMQQAMREGRLQMQEGQEQGKNDKLNDMIQRQQELRDKTFREGRENKGQSQELSEQQDQLRRQLDEMRKGQQGQKGQDGQEQGENDQTREGFDQAEREMGNARDALKKGDNSGAMEAQRRALQGLQQGAQGQAQNGQAQQGQQPGQGEGEGQGSGNGQARQGQPQGNRGTDPLGRQTGRERGSQSESATGSDGRGNSQGTSSIGERAGQILDELRRRSSDLGRSIEERDYIDRLLKGLK